MKPQILDTPFRDSFSDFLQKGETIIWVGQPSTKVFGIYPSNSDAVDNYDNYSFWSLIFIGLAIIVIFQKAIFLGLLFLGLLVLLVKILPFWFTKNKQNYQYAITQGQILFRFKTSWFKKFTIHSIPFSKIKDIIVVMNYDVEQMKNQLVELQQSSPYELQQLDHLKDIGTIFLVPHHPELIDLETVDLRSGNKRHQPTLELLEDANKVAKIIREGIRNTIVKL